MRGDLSTYRDELVSFLAPPDPLVRFLPVHPATGANFPSSRKSTLALCVIILYHTVSANRINGKQTLHHGGESQEVPGIVVGYAVGHCLDVRQPHGRSYLAINPITS